MLKHPAPLLDGSHRGHEAAKIVARAVVFSAPSGVVDGCHGSPSLARRVRHYRVRSVIAACVPGLIPRVHARQIEICAACLDVQGGNRLVVHEVSRNRKALAAYREGFGGGECQALACGLRSFLGML